MPIRTSSSFNRQLQKNGARLHAATLSRAHSRSTDAAAGEPEQALREERAALKAAKADKQAQGRLPKPVPVKADKPAKESKASAKATLSRAEKSTKKAESLEAAKRADRKSAKT